jgi:hypothetical protein
MNIRTLRKTLDDYGFETEKVLDCLLDVYIKQHVSNRGVLAQDISGFEGVLCSYHLLEKHSWSRVILFKCTTEGEKIAQTLLRKKIQPAFEEFKKTALEGSYLILRYLLYLLNQGKNNPSERPELKLLSSVAPVQNLLDHMASLLLQQGLAREVHQYTASGPGRKVTVTVPDLYAYFEPYYLREERILSFEQILESVSKNLNMFRLLYFYEPKSGRIFLRKLREYKLSPQDMAEILEEMKQKNLIDYFYDPIMFRIKDKKVYKQFLKENFLSGILDKFSLKMQQPIRNNLQAYGVLADFEEHFRTFLEKTLGDAQENWEERIPQEIMKRLRERQNDARIRRKKVYSVLHYTDFPNYLSIILHRTDKLNNWELFEPYFVSIGWIKGRLIELNEIRNDLTHPKPLEPLQFRKLQLYVDEIRERIRSEG